MSLLASPSGKGSTHTSFTRWCDPPGGKHRQLARQVGVLRVFSPISHSFPDGHSCFANSTLHGDLVREPQVHVTGFGYDMILLSVKGPGGARVAPARKRAPRRPRHHTSPPKKRCGQRHCYPSASSRPTVHARQEVTQEPTAPRAETVGMMARFHEDRTTAMGDGAPRAPSPATRYFHTGCSPQEERYRSVWTMPRCRSPGRYVQTPRRTWRDQWSSHATLMHSNRRPSCRISLRYEASAD